MRRALLLQMLAAAAVLLLALVAQAAAVEDRMEGPLEDIQDLLRSASSASSSLSALRARPAPQVVDVQHHHVHVLPAGASERTARRIAKAATPPPPPVRIVKLQNAVKAARHAREDRAFARAAAAPQVTTVDVKHSVKLVPANTREYTIRGQRGDSADEKKWEVQGSGFHFPLVDRRLKRASFPLVAETDGVHKADGSNPDSQPKAHTAAELQEEALRLLAKAKELQAQKSEAEQKQLRESLGVFDSRDVNYEDELTRLKRASARMNRLLEQIETPRPDDSFEGHIARQKYYLKLYATLKKEVSQILEEYALRTGNSIFAIFGDGKMDPAIAAFLPPNSVAGILAHYANPTRDREDETPRDVVSGKDAKRIRYAIDYYHAKKNSTLPPLPPTYAATDAELKAAARDADQRLNKVVATQHGAFGQNRPAVTMGEQAIGRSSVHISVVNPTETQHERGLPYQVNLKRPAPPAAAAAAAPAPKAEEKKAEEKKTEEKK